MRILFVVIFASFILANQAFAINSSDLDYSHRSKNFIAKLTNVLEQRWPVFKKRALKFIDYSKSAVAHAAAVSRVNFDNNLRLILSNTLYLNKFEIQGNLLVTEEQALTAANLDHGQWLWGLNLSRTERNIKQLAWVKSANTDISIFPVKMKVKIEEHSPWMLAEFSRRLWIVSEQGSLLSPVAEVKNVETLRSLRALPRLIGLGENPQSEEQSWSGDQTYLRSENARYHHAVKSIKFLKDAGGIPYRAGLIKLLPDGALKISAAERSKLYPDVIIQVSSAEDAKSKIQILNKVIKDLEQRNELAKNIDLRFENRAIVN